MFCFHYNFMYHLNMHLMVENRISNFIWYYQIWYYSFCLELCFKTDKFSHELEIAKSLLGIKTRFNQQWFFRFFIENKKENYPRQLNALHTTILEWETLICDQIRKKFHDKGERKELLESSEDSRELVHATSRNLIYLICKRFMKRTRVEEREKTAACSTLTKDTINDYDTISRAAHAYVKLLTRTKKNSSFFPSLTKYFFVRGLLERPIEGREARCIKGSGGCGFKSEMPRISSARQIDCGLKQEKKVTRCPIIKAQWLVTSFPLGRTSWQSSRSRFFLSGDAL